VIERRWPLLFAIAKLALTGIVLFLAVWICSASFVRAEKLTNAAVPGSLRWAAWIATALASAVAGLRALDTILSPVDGPSDRPLEAIGRVWLTAFVILILALEVSAALGAFSSLQQQRLCANAARMLKAPPDQLRAYGLDCPPPTNGTAATHA
jgi:hypothetical protein